MSKNEDFKTCDTRRMPVTNSERIEIKTKSENEVPAWADWGEEI